MKIVTLSSVMLVTVSGAFSVSHARAQDTSKPSTVGETPTQKLPLVGYLSRNPIAAPRNLAAEEAHRKALAAQAEGELLLKAGKPQEAIAAFQESIGYDRINGLAFQLLAESYAATGQLDKAVDTYRTVMYNWIAPGVGSSQGNEISVVMDFALLLLKTKNIEEAIVWYNHGADLMNPSGLNAQGNPNTKVRFPRFGTNKQIGEISYTPQRLQALAYVALATTESNMNGQKASTAHFQEAIRLYPESPIPYFFLGEYGSPQDDDKAAYAKAAQLGDDKVKAAAYKEIENRG